MFFHGRYISSGTSIGLERVERGTLCGYFDLWHGTKVFLLHYVQYITIQYNTIHKVSSSLVVVFFLVVFLCALVGGWIGLYIHTYTYMPLRGVHRLWGFGGMDIYIYNLYK